MTIDSLKVFDLIRIILILSAISSMAKASDKFEPTLTCNNDGFVETILSESKGENSIENTSLVPYSLADNWRGTVALADKTGQLEPMINKNAQCKASHKDVLSNFPYFRSYATNVEVVKFTINKVGLKWFAQKYCSTPSRNQSSKIVAAMYSKLIDYKSSDIQKFSRCLVSMVLGQQVYSSGQYFGVVAENIFKDTDLEDFVNRGNLRKFESNLKKEIKYLEKIGTVKALNTGYMIQAYSSWSGRFRFSGDNGQKRFVVRDIVKAEKLRKYIYESYFKLAQTNEYIQQFREKYIVVSEQDAIVEIFRSDMTVGGPIFGLRKVMVTTENGKGEQVPFGNGHVEFKKDDEKPNGKRREVEDRTVYTYRIPTNSRKLNAYAILNDMQNNNEYLWIPKAENPVVSTTSGHGETYTLGFAYNPHFTRDEKIEGEHSAYGRGYMGLLTQFINSKGDLLVDFSGRPCVLESSEGSVDKYRCKFFIVYGK